MKNPFFIIAALLIVVPFLCLTVIFISPFAAIYLIFDLFKKNNNKVEKKETISLFDFALKNYSNGIKSK